MTDKITDSGPAPTDDVGSSIPNPLERPIGLRSKRVTDAELLDMLGAPPGLRLGKRFPPPSPKGTGKRVATTPPAARPKRTTPKTKRPSERLLEVCARKGWAPPALQVDVNFRDDVPYFRVGIQFAAGERHYTEVLPEALGLEHSQDRAAAQMLHRLGGDYADGLSLWLRPLPDRRAGFRLRRLCDSLAVPHPHLKVVRDPITGHYTATYWVEHMTPVSAASPHEDTAVLSAAEGVTAVLYKLFGEMARAAEQRAIVENGPEYQPDPEPDSVPPQSCDWSRNVTQDLYRALAHLEEGYAVLKRRNRTAYYWLLRTPEGAWLCFTSPKPHLLRLITVLRPDTHQPVDASRIKRFGFDLRAEADRVAERLRYHVIDPCHLAVRDDMRDSPAPAAASA